MFWDFLIYICVYADVVLWLKTIYFLTHKWQWQINVIKRKLKIQQISLQTNLEKTQTNLEKHCKIGCFFF